MSSQRNLLDDENILMNPNYNAMHSSIPVGGCRNCKSRRRMFCGFLILLMLVSSMGIILVSHMKSYEILGNYFRPFKFSLYLLRGQIEEVRQMDYIIIRALVNKYDPNYPREFTDSTTYWPEPDTTPEPDSYWTTRNWWWSSESSRGYYDYSTELPMK